MTANCGLISTNVVLAGGPLVAGLWALAVSPGVMMLLAITLERRMIRPATSARGFLFGDVLLAVAVALAASDVRPPCGPAGPRGQLVIQALWLLFGWWQCRAEIRQGVYSSHQALSPTKLWHQFVVYPVLGSWVLVSAGTVLTTIAERPLRAVLMLALVMGWVILCWSDSSRPTLNHVPFDWRRLQPQDQPWTPGSVTLRAEARRRSR